MLSASEDEYSETEKILLEKAKTDENSDIEESEVSLSSLMLEKLHASVITACSLASAPI
jgi:hypothetical protein